LTAVIFDRRVGIVFSLTKVTALRLMTVIILSAWVLKIIIFKENKFVRSILDWPVLTYLLCVTVAAIMSVHVYISVSGFYGRFEGLITWYNLGLLFFITTNYIRDIKGVKRLSAMVFISGVIMAVYSIIQRQGIDPYQWGGVSTWERVIATVGQPNFYAAFADMAFFITLFLFLLPKKEDVAKPHTKVWGIPHTSVWWFLPLVYFFSAVLIFLLMIYNLGTNDVILWYLSFGLMSVLAVLFVYTFEDIPGIILDLLLGIGMILICISLFYTQSRGGFLGFFAALSLFVFIGPRRIFVLSWQKVLALALALLFITGSTFLNPQFSLFTRMAGEIKVEAPAQDKDLTKIEFEGAAGSRGETWKSGFGIIADRPFFGIGPENLKMIFPRYETDLFRFKEAFHVKQDRCHNETLDVPVTKGLVTFFVYLLILFLIFKKGWGGQSDEKRLILSAFLAAFLAYLIQNQFSFGVIAITSLFWIIWAVIVKTDDLPEENKETINDKEVPIDEIPWLWIAVLLVAIAVFGYFSAKPFWADREFKMGKTLSEVKRFQESLKYYDNSLGFQPFEGGPITHKGISLINMAASAAPDQRAEIYRQAKETFRYGTRVDPYNADNFYILSRISLIEGNIPETTKLADIALKIDPYYAEVYLILAAVAEKQGNAKKAMDCYKEAYRINPNIIEAQEKVVWSLIESGKLDEAYKMVQETLMKFPKHVNSHAVLGIIYQRMGEREKARQEFETVIYLDPNNQYAKKVLGK